MTSNDRQTISRPADVSGGGPLPRALWVTNLAAPYRVPLWSALSSSFHLKVGLLESTSRLARDHAANRGSDWAPITNGSFDVGEYATTRIKRGEDRHYFLRSARALRDAASADVILLGGWDSPAYWQLLALAKARRTAVVGFYESVLASQSRGTGPLAAARAQFFSSLDRIVVPGPSALEAIMAMGVPAERVLAGFNAVDVEAFSAAPEGVEHVGHRYLYVGQLIDRKNVETIIRAFATIASPDDQLTLVGKGDQRDALHQLTTTLGIAEAVDFIDFVPNKELPQLMATQDTLVLASKVEVWGLVVNEALAAGMQAVVSNNCGVAASVADMPGVYLTSLAEPEVAATMARARDEFHGRIDDPPVRRETPEKFAGVFAQAFTEAIAAHRVPSKG